MKKFFSILLCAALLLAVFSPALAQEEVTVEFVQWWEPELPEGSFRAIMDDFEAQNPGIKVKLISNPFASTRDLVVSGATTGTLSDVVGLDGAWINDLVKLGALLPMDSYMAADEAFNADDVAASVKVNDETYMFAVASFTYHLFANTGLLKAAGIDEMPKTWSEFEAVCKAVSEKNPDAHGWDFPFSSLYGSAGQDQLMSWVWATGGKMLTEDGKPNFVGNETMKKTFEFFKQAYDNGIMSPGVFSKQSQDMFEEFASGRSAFMVNGLSAIASLHERNTDLEFDVLDMPVADDYTGTKGMLYAAWGIGVSASSKHPDEAWKLVSYLMSPEVSTRIAEIANSLPGNKQSTASSEDPAFLNGYRLFQESSLINEFIGMPSSNELNRLLMEQVQMMLQDNQSVEDTLANIQSSWEAELTD